MDSFNIGFCKRFLISSKLKSGFKSSVSSAVPLIFISSRNIEEREYIAPPSTPFFVIINYPRTILSLKDSRTDFNDFPSKRLEKISDHSVTKPQLVG